MSEATPTPTAVPTPTPEPVLIGDGGLEFTPAFRQANDISFRTAGDLIEAFHNQRADHSAPEVYEPPEALPGVTDQATYDQVWSAFTQSEQGQQAAELARNLGLSQAQYDDLVADIYPAWAEAERGRENQNQEWNDTLIQATGSEQAASEYIQRVVDTLQDPEDKALVSRMTPQDLRVALAFAGVNAASFAGVGNPTAGAGAGGAPAASGTVRSVEITDGQGNPGTVQVDISDLASVNQFAKQYGKLPGGGKAADELTKMHGEWWKENRRGGR